MYWYRIDTDRLRVADWTRTNLAIRIESLALNQDIELLNAVLYHEPDPNVSCTLLPVSFQEDIPSMGYYQWPAAMNTTFYFAIYHAIVPIPALMDLKVLVFETVETSCQDAAEVRAQTSANSDVVYASSNVTARFRPNVRSCVSPSSSAQPFPQSRLFTYRVDADDHAIHALVVEINSSVEPWLVHIYHHTQSTVAATICDVPFSDWMCADYMGQPEANSNGSSSYTMTQSFVILRIQPRDSFAILVEDNDMASGDADFDLHIRELRNDINPCHSARDLTTINMFQGPPKDETGNLEEGGVFDQFPGWTRGVVATWYKIEAPDVENFVSFLLRLQSPENRVKVDLFQGGELDECLLLPMGPKETLENNGGIAWVHPSRSNVTYYLAIYACCGQVSGRYQLQLEASVLCAATHRKDSPVVDVPQALLYSPGNVFPPKPYILPDCARDDHSVRQPGDLVSVYEITAGQNGTLYLQADQSSDANWTVRAALYRGDPCASNDNGLECVGGYHEDKALSGQGKQDFKALRVDVTKGETFWVALFHTPSGWTTSDRSATFAATVEIRQNPETPETSATNNWKGSLWECFLLSIASLVFRFS